MILKSQKPNASLANGMKRTRVTNYRLIPKLIP